MPPDDVVQRLSKALRDEGILTPNTLAYALATTKAESNFQPIPEYMGKEQARRLGYSGGDNYYGRGYIQLTHDYNYKDIGERIGMGDALLQNPDLALDPDVAAKVLAAFFKDRGVAQAAERGDFVGARRAINPDARGQEIASYAQQFLPVAEKYASLTPTPTMATANQGKTSSNPIDKILDYVTPNAYADSQTNYTPVYNNNVSGSQPYTVQQGDTLWDIASRYLGDGAKWQELGYSGSPYSLQVGTKLNVPNMSKNTPLIYNNNATGTYRPSSGGSSSGSSQNYTPSNANFSSASGGASYVQPPSNVRTQSGYTAYVNPASQKQPQVSTRPSTSNGLKLDFTPAGMSGGSASFR